MNNQPKQNAENKEKEPNDMESLQWVIKKLLNEIIDVKNNTRESSKMKNKK